MLPHTPKTAFVSLLELTEASQKQENLNRQDFKTILYQQCYLQVAIMHERHDLQLGLVWISTKRKELNA